MKGIVWVGNSYKDLKGFPVVVQQVAGFQLHLIQSGKNPDDWKPMPSIGAAVREVRIHVDGEYRIIYVAKFEEGVYVLHAFQKKSQKTARKDLDLAKKRLSELNQQRAK